MLGVSRLIFVGSNDKLPACRTPAAQAKRGAALDFTGRCSKTNAAASRRSPSGRDGARPSPVEGHALSWPKERTLRNDKQLACRGNVASVRQASSLSLRCHPQIGRGGILRIPLRRRIKVQCGRDGARPSPEEGHAPSWPSPEGPRAV